MSLKQHRFLWMTMSGFAPCYKHKKGSSGRVWCHCANLFRQMHLWNRKTSNITNSRDWTIESLFLIPRPSYQWQKTKTVPIIDTPLSVCRTLPPLNGVLPSVWVSSLIFYPLQELTSAEAFSISSLLSLFAHNSGITRDLNRWENKNKISREEK